jgi:hypothetical protein
MLQILVLIPPGSLRNQLMALAHGVERQPQINQGMLISQMHEAKNIYLKVMPLVEDTVMALVNLERVNFLLIGAMKKSFMKYRVVFLNRSSCPQKNNCAMLSS